MASKNIKGITIKIGAETTELTKALKDVNSVVAKSNSELRDLNKALKLDPRNTELLAQKQEVLKNNIKATTERLNTLKEAQRQMGDYNKLTDEQKESYRALSVEIAKSESALRGMNKELQQTTKTDFTGFQLDFKKLGDIAVDVAKKLAQVTAALSAALSGVVIAGIKSFGEYEQQLGGIEAMFDKTTESGIAAFNQIKATGENAWKDLTLSTTDYYKTFTSTYTLIKNSIPDHEKAIETTNRMIQLESDLANTFGYDITQASNAINWALKGSYNYIDNLNLGIKGTKEGFLEAAHECGYLVDSVDELTSDQILDILEQYANRFGVLGRTASEAAGTIQGSFKSMKAAFDNFLNGSGSPQALAEATTNFITNIANVLVDLAPTLLDGIVALIQTILPQVVELIVNLLPQLLDAVTSLIDQLLDLLKNNTDGIANTISTLFIKAVEFITENLPKIVEAALLIMITLADGLVKNDAIEKLVEKIPIIIEDLCDALTDPDMLIKMTEAALKLMIALAKGLIKALPELLRMPETIINNYKNKLQQKINTTDWGALGSDIIRGICDGFGRLGNYISNKVNEVKEQITNKFKKIFGIASPSKLMRDTIGFNISAGIGEGIEEGIPTVLKDVNTAMKSLNAGIEASVNPNINPSITYETNYNLMARAVKEALQDMDVVLDDDRMGKFVVRTVTEEVYS